MTATDELRRLLDERGVECRQTEWIDGITVKWRGSDGSEYGARNGLSFDGPTGGLVLYDLTPEQAVEATLGSDLQAENAKLRELVRKVEHYEQLGCHDCPHGGSCAVDTLYDEGCAMSREIEFEKRKLGIEVDA